MVKYNTSENPPKHILKTGDLKIIKNDLEKIYSVHGAVTGAVSGGALGGVAGAVSGAIVGGVASLVADDMINVIEDVLEIEGYTKAEIAEFEKDAKMKSLAKSKRGKKKLTKKDETWFGEWW